MSLLHFVQRTAPHSTSGTDGATDHPRKKDTGEKFSAQTHSQSVNRHGALFQLEEIVLVGQHSY